MKGYLDQAEGGAAAGAVSGILLDLGMSSMQARWHWLLTHRVEP